MLDLAQLFLRHYSGSPGAPSAALQEALRVGFDQARERWPRVRLSEESYVRHVAAQVDPSAPDLVQALASLNLPDLYLACACIDGQEQALLAFDSEMLGQVPAFVARFRLSPAQVEDLRQGLRARLLFGAAADGQKQLVQYRGQGALKSWIRVTAVRAALSLLRDKDETLQQLDSGDRLLDRMAEKESPEQLYLRTRYKADYEEAVRTSFSMLTDEQRSVLQLYYVEGLNTRQIAQLFRVNATTASRWVAAARETIAQETRRLLRERLRVTDGELASIYRAIASQLALSIRSALLGGGSQR